MQHAQLFSPFGKKLAIFHLLRRRNLSLVGKKILDNYF
jgi:hypothetical protein